MLKTYRRKSELHYFLTCSRFSYSFKLPSHSSLVFLIFYLFSSSAIAEQHQITPAMVNLPHTQSTSDYGVLNQLFPYQGTFNQGVFNERAFKQIVFNQEATSQEVFNQEASNQEAFNQEASTRKTLTQGNLNKHPIAKNLLLGIDQKNKYLPLLKGKKVGLVVNQTSVTREQHLADLLIQNGINVKVLFAPEHGIRGNKGAGEHIDDGKDHLTGVPIQSIYGKQKSPPEALMLDIDVIVFDIQDVGLRFYTYISSMHYMMQASAKYGVEFLVLDRPNPNGMYTQGPILDKKFQSFVGMHPIPVLHGLTVGELALMIKGERWIENADKLDLKVITVQGYAKSLAYSVPVPPSPNLPNDIAIQLYPSLCFFEPTIVSIGRGTTIPFQMIGHDELNLGDFKITPMSMPYSAPSPKLEGKELFAMDLRDSGISGLNLSLLEAIYKQSVIEKMNFFTSPNFFDKLAGTDSIRKALLAGRSLKDLEQTWAPALSQYKKMREVYLLYPQN